MTSITVDGRVVELFCNSYANTAIPLTGKIGEVHGVTFGYTRELDLEEKTLAFTHIIVQVKPGGDGGNDEDMAEEDRIDCFVLPEDAEFLQAHFGETPAAEMAAVAIEQPAKAA